MTVLVTGATGAVGKHVLIRLEHLGLEAKVLDLRKDEPQHADHVIHCAGVNKGSGDELTFGNAELSEKLISLLDKKPKTLTFANSVKALTDQTDYSEGKRMASWILQDYCDEAGIIYRNHYLPNLIGKYGKPFNNMVATTIVSCLVHDLPMPSLNSNLFGMGLLEDAAKALCDFENDPVEIETHTTSAVWLRVLAERALEGKPVNSVLGKVVAEMIAYEQGVN